MPTTTGRLFVVETSVDDDSAMAISDDPDIEVDWHGQIVRIGFDEIIASKSFRYGGVPNRENLVNIPIGHDQISRATR